MRRVASIFFLFVATCVAALSVHAGSSQGQASAGGASSSGAKPAAATLKKTSTTHKKHHTATKFVPKQKAPTADRISEIQASLARGGYYQGDPNGKWDGSTISALQKFQSSNGLDATGKLDAPSLQKLGLGSDIAGVSAPKPKVPSTTAPANAAPGAAAPTSGGVHVSASATTAAINTPAGALANNSAKQ